MPRQVILAVFLLIVTDASYLFAQWRSIVGIPEPPFGVNETHYMYAGKTYDFGAGPQPYKIGPAGPYTHFVDTNHPAATDTNNPYGTHDKPRVSYPVMRNLPPGSVVELHGGPFGSEVFQGNGTADAPIFIRGTPENMPRVKPPYSVYGDFYIFENIEFNFDRMNRRAFFFGPEGSARSHIAIRNNEIHNLELVPSTGRAVISLAYQQGTQKLTNIVIARNHFHHMGEGRTGGKRDVTAVYAGPNAERIWIVDNRFHHIGGDGVQLNMDNAAAEATPPNHIYIGRNTFHDTFENAIDLKMCQDVIISSNIAYNFGKKSELEGPDGDSAAFRYGSGGTIPAGYFRNNVWTIFNYVYDSPSSGGALTSWNQETEIFADQIYYIGNVVRDCHIPQSESGSAAAFGWWNQGRIYGVNNTVYNVDVGFAAAGERPLYPLEQEGITIVNNIVSLHQDSKGSNALSVYGTEASLNRSFIRNNLFYSPAGTANIRWGKYDQDGRLRWNQYSFDQFKELLPEKMTETISTDPRFQNPLQNNFRLQTGSPAIDAGYAHLLFDRFFERYGVRINLDFAGQPIPQGRIDMGAFEYSSRPASPQRLRQLD